MSHSHYPDAATTFIVTNSSTIDTYWSGTLIQYLYRADGFQGMAYSLSFSYLNDYWGHRNTANYYHCRWSCFVTALWHSSWIVFLDIIFSLVYSLFRNVRKHFVKNNKDITDEQSLRFIPLVSTRIFIAASYYFGWRRSLSDIVMILLWICCRQALAPEVVMNSIAESIF